MSRLSLAAALAIPLLLASACEEKPSTNGATPAQPTAATPVAPAAQPAAQPAATAPADAGPSAAADASPAAAAQIDPASLAGQYAFGWSGGKTLKCKKVDGKMLAKLAGKGTACRRGDPDQAFAEGAGVWSTCQVGKAEWVVFATKAICQEQLETMEANAP